MPTFTNQALLSFNGVSYASNIITGELVDVLAVTKNALVDNYNADDRITYVISIVNSGTVPITDITLSDNLGAYTLNATTLTPLNADTATVNYYINGALQPIGNLTIAAGPPMTIEGINVPAGGNALIVYEAQVNNLAPLSTGSAINNTVTVTGASLQTPVTATESVTVADAPSLSISKFLSPGTVAENTPLTYTFLIQNAGNTATDPTDRIVLTDTFNPRLSNITVTYNDVVWTEGVQYNYNEATGEFSTVDNVITVPAATITQDPTTGLWAITPGTSRLEVTGTV